MRRAAGYLERYKELVERSVGTPDGWRGDIGNER